MYNYVGDPNEWIDPLGLSRRGKCATRKHMDDVRDQFLDDNQNASNLEYLAGGRDRLTGDELPETHLGPNTQLASSRAGGSYTDMTFDVNGQTVYVQTVDAGNVHGMSQREWDNANRITRQDPDAVVVTVVKGNTINPGDLNVGNMNPGSIYRFQENEKRK